VVCVNKIHIIGRSGSGKTFAGRVISEKFGLSHLILDEIYFDSNMPVFGTRADSVSRDRSLAKFITQDRWVVEGAYVGQWIMPSFASADMIVAICPSRLKCNWRYTVRWAKRKVGIIPCRQEKKASLLWWLSIIKVNRGYHRVELNRAREMLAGVDGELVEVSGLDELLAYFTAIK